MHYTAGPPFLLRNRLPPFFGYMYWLGNYCGVGGFETFKYKYFSKSILFGSPFRLEKVPIMSPFHSKMDPQFYKFKNPLHVGAVHDALDNMISTAKPLIQWQWLDGKKPLKNH